MVMSHMQYGFTLVRKEMAIISGRIDRLEKKVDEGFSRVGRRFDWVDAALDNIDTRLDDVELEFLPKRVRKLEKKVFAGVDS